MLSCWLGLGAARKVLCHRRAVPCADVRTSICARALAWALHASGQVAVVFVGRSYEQNWAERLRASMHHQAESLGNLLVEAFHYLALFAIGATVFWAAGAAFLGMVNKGHASIDDILLLFIYLELGAMVGIYFKTNHMPVRFLIYVAMTALTRLMIADIQHNHTPDDGIILVSVALLLLALAILVVRFASARFPSAKSDGAAARRVASEDAEGEA